MSRCVVVVAVASRRAALCRASLVCGFASLAACTDAITLEVASERPVPSAVDAICVGVADTAPSGGHFGRHYALEGELAMLPQTLRVEAGDAASALAWVRADRGGVPTLVETANIDFADDVTLTLPRCQVGRGGTIAPVGTPVGPPGALLAASYGQGGALVVAAAADGAVVLAAKDGGLAVHDSPTPPPGSPRALIAADLDGDCDDDIVLATDGAAPIVWERDGATFVPGAQVGDATMAALAAADVDHDGDMDLVLGGGGTLELWVNGGAATFTHAPQALSAAGRASMISALALGDLDGDGNADLVVGQAGPPLAAWLGVGGRFEPADGVLPPVPLDVERFALADADGDFDPDLAIAIRDMPMRLLIDREGRLEDQSFVRIPAPVPTAHAVAFGGWDAGCEPDAVIAADGGAATLSGTPDKFTTAAAAPAATDVTMIDLDGNGALDAILATPDGVQWLAH